MTAQPPSSACCQRRLHEAIPPAIHAVLLHVDSAETEKRENGDDDDDQPYDVDDIVHLPVLLDARFSKLHARHRSGSVARLFGVFERIAAVWAFTRVTVVAVLPHLERPSLGAESRRHRCG